MLTKAIQFQILFYWAIENTDKTQKRREIRMVKKLVVLAVLFVALCFAGGGCVGGGAYVRGDHAPYYDGPHRIDGGLYYYYNGGFYVHDGGEYRFHHYTPKDQRGYYEERYREHEGKRGGGRDDRRDGYIRIIAATYGRNCGAPYGNATNHLAEICDGRATCEYVIDFVVIGDPARGSAKDYFAEWECGRYPGRGTVGAGAEASGQGIVLRCPVR
jgi:hypothetical protein